MQIGIDSDVIQRIRKGDRAAIGALFERYHTDIFRYLYYKVGDTHIAEDLASEVFLRLIRSLAQKDPVELQPQAWLYRIARNLAIDHYRKSQAQQPVMLDENVSSDVSIDTQYEQNFDSQALYKCIKALPYDQREVIILRFINRMPISEVANTLERSEDAIKGLQHRALLSLRRALLDRGIAPGLQNEL
jgi:RNA polymerase sigma-70 factor (ECF subfamily)